MPILPNPQGFQFSVTKDTTSPAGITASILPLVVVGYCSALAVATPTPLASPGAAIESAGNGIGVECAGYQLGSDGGVGLVHLLNPGSTTDGSYGSINESWANAAPPVAVADDSVMPTDTLSVKVRFPVGGTLGTSGIKYEASIDGGNSYFTAAALGTNTAIDLSQYGAGKYNLDPDEATVVAYLNNLVTKFQAHTDYTTGSVHGAADPATYTIGTATDWASAYTVFGQLKTAGIAHVGVGSTTHGTADTTASAAITAIGAPSTPHTLVDACLAFKAAFFGTGTLNSGHARRTSSSIHGAEDTTNQPSATAASHGIVTANDYFEVPIDAPAPNATQMQTALRSLRDYTGQMGTIVFAQPVDGAMLDIIKAEIIDLWKYNVFLDVVCSARVPDSGETVTEYAAYLNSEFGAKNFVDSRLCSGGVYQHSALYTAGTGKIKQLRPRAWSVAMLAATTEPQTLLSAVVAPPNVFIKNALGQTLSRCFDEGSGNLFSVLNRTCGTRTRKDKKDNDGVHITQDVCLYAPNSDWVLGPYSEVVNHLIRAELPYMASASEPPEGYDAPPEGPLPDEVKKAVEAQANDLAYANGKDQNRCNDARVTITDTSNAKIKWRLAVVPNFYAFNGGELTVNVSQSALVREVG